MEILIARQPVFDRQEEVVAFELLYHDRDAGPGGGAEAPATGAHSPATVPETAEQLVLHTAVGVGLEHLTGGLPAFVNASRELLTSRAFELLDPASIVVQVRVSDARDAALHTPLEDLYTAGYHLALDGFPDPAEAALVGMVEYIKVEVLDAPPPELGPAIQGLRRRGVRVIARNVPNRAVRDACLAAGIDLFQGWLFARPEAVRTRDLPIQHIRTFQLMRRVQDVNIPEHTIEDEFRADVSLTFKLLRIVNSAAVGGRGVRSIAHAIRLLGRETLYRWLGLLLLSSSGERGVQREILFTALARARWCELLADAGARPLASGSLYMIGLLSLMDTLLGSPMQDLVEALDLAPEVGAALVGRRGPMGQVLALAENYEAGQFDEAVRLSTPLGIREDEIGRLYIQSICWARERCEGL